MSTGPGRRERGAALLLMLLILALGASWYLVSRVEAMSGNRTATNINRNADVLAQAKQTLLGYVAHEAAIIGENDPGAFPCPEASGNIGTANEGVAASNCALPAVGRLPWKTLGIDRALDASGEPLWYVVASGWAKPSAGANTVINSNCTDSVSAMTCWTGQMTVDAQAKAAVALIIAPGPAMNVQASTGCAARNQARAAPSPAMNYLDYFECSDLASATFVTTAPSTSFNDQVLKITAAEALPLIEAAVVSRVQREIAPQMKAAYNGGLWPANPVLPFAVPIGNPTTTPANKFQGSAGQLQGLLPASYSFASPAGANVCTCDAPNAAPCLCQANSLGQRSLEPCDTADSRCDPGFVTWRTTATATATAGAMTVESVACTVAGTPSTLTCKINASTDTISALVGNTSMTFKLDAVANNVGMTWRQVSSPIASSRAPQITGIDPTYVDNTISPPIISPFNYRITQATLNNDGSATVSINARFSAGSGSILAVLGSLTCSILGIPLCYEYTVAVPIGIIADHPVVHPTSTTYNWFFRNRWHEVSYYAVAPGIAPSGAAPRSCTDNTSCLQLTYLPASGKQRALLVVGGPKLLTQVRPAVSASDLLEGANASADVNTPLTTPFTLRSPTLAVNRTFNDHVGVIDANP